MNYYIPCSLVFRFDYDVLARSIWTRYHRANRDFWGVYFINCFLLLLIGLYHGVKCIWLDFSFQIKVEHLQILLIVPLWTVFWVLPDVVLMILNQLDWMLHLWCLSQHWLFLVGFTCTCTFISLLIYVMVKLRVLVNSPKRYFRSVDWFVWKCIWGK